MLPRISSFLASLFMAFFLLGCSVSTQPFNEQNVDSIGQIIDLNTNQTISFTELLSRLSSQDYVLVGEEHTQLIHHQIEWYLFNQLTKKAKLHLIALEMLNVDQQPAIDRIQFNRPVNLSATDLREAIQWQKWDWKMYQDLVVESLRSNSRVVATNLTDKEVEILLNGAEPLKGSVSTSTEVKQKIAQLLSSINHGSVYPMENMVAVQQFRDRRMAEKLVKNALSTSLLIAGNHHVRKDLGVPLHIAEYDRTKKVAVLMLKTEREGITSSQADYLWVTQ